MTFSDALIKTAAILVKIDSQLNTEDSRHMAVEPLFNHKS